MLFKDMTAEEKRLKREALFSISSPEMELLQKRTASAVSSEERFRLALEMSDLCIKLAIQAIRDKHPQWTRNEVMVEYFRWACYPQPLPSGVEDAILRRRYED